MTYGFSFCTLAPLRLGPQRVAFKISPVLVRQNLDQEQ